jgi:hypothetical protein
MAKGPSSSSSQPGRTWNGDVPWDTHGCVQVQLNDPPDRPSQRRNSRQLPGQLPGTVLVDACLAK